MNKQEIQALIDAKIAGQGSAIDVGGALPIILHEILEMAAGGENVQSNWDEENTQSPQYIQNKPTIPAPYSLPIASDEILGGIKVGDNLSIDPETGALSASGSGSQPLIVEGTRASTVFVPNSGQPTKADAVEAAKNGRIVIIKTPAEEDETKWDWHYPQILYEYDGTIAFEGITWE